jgi:hypothetical protein
VLTGGAPLRVQDVADMIGTTPAAVQQALTALGMPTTRTPDNELALHPDLVPLALGLTPGQWQRAQVDHAIRQLSGDDGGRCLTPPGRPLPVLALAPPVPFAADALPSPAAPWRAAL